MLRCIIVDDESGAVEILSRYVKRTEGLELVRSFRDSIEALAFLAGHDVDIVFLDIDMPNLSGMHLTELIRGRDIRVIFCTAYSEYAVESYEKDAIDYLLKPITYERFCRAVEKAKTIRSKQPGTEDREVREIQTKGGKLFFKSGPRIHQVDTREILYIEKEGHYVIFHTPEGPRLSRMNMGELLRSLPPDGFVRVHRSFVVALDKIDTIEKHTVVIANKRIPIGDNYRNEFLGRIKYSGD